MFSLSKQDILKNRIAAKLHNSNYLQHLKLFTASAVFTLLSVNATHTLASDISIYRDAIPGSVTLMLAIDTSRSMEEADDAQTTYDDYKGDAKWQLKDCYFGTYNSTMRTTTGSVSNQTTVPILRSGGEFFSVKDRTVKIEEKTVGGVTYERKYCEWGTGTNKKKYYDRLTLVKDGLFDLLWGNEDQNILPVSNDKVIGLSSFSNNLGSGTTIHRGGSILVPARRLDAIEDGKTQRQILMEAVANLDIDGSGGTPSSYLYAETAAYLLGTTTLPTDLIGKEQYRFNSSSRKWQKCSEWNGAISQFQTCKDLKWGSELTNTDTFNRSVYTSSSRGKSDKAFKVNEMFRPIYKDNNNLEYYVRHEKNSKSGFTNSVSVAKNGITYRAPASIVAQTSLTEAEKVCSGQGVYFLTDGAATQTDDTNSLLLMKSALGSSTGSTFNCNSPKITGGASNASWSCISNFAERLVNGVNIQHLGTGTTASNIKIKTAVVGFAKDFDGIRSYDDTDLTVTANRTSNLNAITATGDIPNTARWGIHGQGGWFSGKTSSDVVNSVNNFLGQIEVNIPSVSTGTATIPVDALYSSKIQPYAYFSQFDPKPGTSDTLWIGNLKKFNVVNGVVLGKNSTQSVVDDSGKIRDLIDLWGAGSNTETSIALKNGARSRLPVGDINIPSTRVLFTNDSAVSNGSNLTKMTRESLVTGTNTNKAYLLSLIGYALDSNYFTNPSNITAAVLNTTPRFKNMGMILHSNPVLLTQKGRVVEDSTAGLITEDREDYALFGSTQGVLHVVDASTGVEKFAFVPDEMIQSQKEYFRNNIKSLTPAGRFAYGIDGAWVAYTEYVPTGDRTVITPAKEEGGEDTIETFEGGVTVGEGQTIKVAQKNAAGITEMVEKILKGKQWVYGGLRMGGRSYYALDLSDISSPKLKFHINPAAVSTDSSPLYYMGQSWSKPNIGWVNWNGQRKLVMFVGGGYDECYEDPTFSLVTTGNNTTCTTKTTAKGNGIYMFDADNGNLLWWSSSHVTADAGKFVGTTTELNSTQATVNTNLKHSVVAKIKTVDRDGDGLIDHLYYGDLGGQVFRTDIDNSLNAQAFAKRNIRLLDLTNTSSNLAPRFYEAPTFTVHRNTTDSTTFGVISIGSGNRSIPMFPVKPDGTSWTTTNYVNDAIYVVYDKDVANKALYSSEYALTSQNIQIGTTGNTLAASTGTTAVPYARGGWYYRFTHATTSDYPDSFKQVMKVIEEPVVIVNDLYVSVYDSSLAGVSGNCGSGVKGETIAYRFCLPYGSCTGGVKSFSLGAGLLGLSVGPDSKGNQEGRGLIFLNSSKKAAAVTNASINDYAAPMKLVPQRWYELFGSGS